LATASIVVELLPVYMLQHYNTVSTSYDQLQSIWVTGLLLLLLPGCAAACGSGVVSKGVSV